MGTAFWVETSMLSFKFPKFLCRVPLLRCNVNQRGDMDYAPHLHAREETPSPSRVSRAEHQRTHTLAAASMDQENDPENAKVVPNVNPSNVLAPRGSEITNLNI